MLYSLLKFLHVLGVVLLVGSVTITAYWKVMADRSRDPRIIAHAQRAVNIGNWLFTFPGIILIIAGGYGMTWLADLNVLAASWLLWGQLLFLLSGAIWLLVLVPLQIRQERAAREFIRLGSISPSYTRDSRRWLIWGILATIPLIAALLVMIVKQ
jgi:uncharacterized membrane protein